MAIISTQVAKSTDIRAAALNLNAKAFEARRTIAGIWDVKPSDAAPPAPESTFQLDMRNETHESIVGEGDERTKVATEHFMPGGKYRSIVKIFTHHEFQKPGQWAMGTGWLIRPDIFVTAGHCSYDWAYKLGRATEVKAYIGYQGDHSVKMSHVQFRSVKRIVTTEGWLKARGQKNFDVSFMQVHHPFTGITPIRYTETPGEGHFSLGVVGYPGDLRDSQTREPGAHMYEMFLETSFELATQTDTMLEYQIDTYGGNSGAPVLKEDHLDSIGTHVYGGTFNSASVIGRYGNPYDDYLMGYDVKLGNDGLNLVPVGAAAAAAAARAPTVSASKVHGRSGATKTTSAKTKRGYQAANDLGSNFDTDEEGLFDTIRGALQIVGGPVGAVSGATLNAVAPILESANSQDYSASSAQEGAMERAILAESALLPIQKMDMHPDDRENFFSDMKSHILEAAPAIKRAAPYVMSAITEPVLRIALELLHNHNQQGSGGRQSSEKLGNQSVGLNANYSNKIDQPGDRDTEAFIQSLHNAMQHGQEELNDETEEGLFDIITVGLPFASKGVIAGAHTGVPILVQKLGDSSESMKLGSTTPIALSSINLAKRALVGEAALQALQKLPRHRLEEEGFMDAIVHAIREIAPVVVKVGPTILHNVSQTVKSLFKADTNQEAAYAGGSPPAKRPRIPDDQRSRDSSREKRSGKDILSRMQEWTANNGL